MRDDNDGGLLPLQQVYDKGLKPPDNVLERFATRQTRRVGRVQELAGAFMPKRVVHISQRHPVGRPYIRGIQRCHILHITNASEIKREREREGVRGRTVRAIPSQRATPCKQLWPTPIDMSSNMYRFMRMFTDTWPVTPPRGNRLLPPFAPPDPQTASPQSPS